MCDTAHEAAKLRTENRCLRLLNPNIAKCHRRTGVRLNADKFGRLTIHRRYAARGIRIIENCGDL